MTPLFIGMGAVLFISLIVYLIRKGAQEFEKERSALFAQYADKHGYQFSLTDTLGLQEKVASIAGFGISKIPLKNIVFIPADQGDIYLFDQMKISGRNAAAQRSVFTVCLIESKNDYGAEVIIHEAVSALNANITRDMGSLVPGTGVIELEDKPFDDRFIVNTQQPEKAKALLNKDVMEYLFNSANQFSAQLALQIKGNMLAVHNAASSKGNVEKEEDLDLLVDIAKGFPVSN